MHFSRSAGNKNLIHLILAAARLLCFCEVLGIRAESLGIGFIILVPAPISSSSFASCFPQRSQSQLGLSLRHRLQVIWELWEPLLDGCHVVAR